MGILAQSCIRTSQIVHNERESSHGEGRRGGGGISRCQRSPDFGPENRDCSRDQPGEGPRKQRLIPKGQAEAEEPQRQEPLLGWVCRETEQQKAASDK